MQIIQSAKASEERKNSICVFRQTSSTSSSSGLGASLKSPRSLRSQSHRYRPHGRRVSDVGSLEYIPSVGLLPSLPPRRPRQARSVAQKQPEWPYSTATKPMATASLAATMAANVPMCIACSRQMSQKSRGSSRSSHRARLDRSISNHSGSNRSVSSRSSEKRRHLSKENTTQQSSKSNLTRKSSRSSREPSSREPHSLLSSLSSSYKSSRGEFDSFVRSFSSKSSKSRRESQHSHHNFQSTSPIADNNLYIPKELLHLGRHRPNLPQGESPRITSLAEAVPLLRAKSLQHKTRESGQKPSAKQHWQKVALLARVSTHFVMYVKTFKSIFRLSQGHKSTFSQARSDDL